MSKSNRQELLTGLLFISPWIIGFIAFQLFPFVQSLYYSLTDFNLIKTPRFVGLNNYIELFTRDRNFSLSLSNTLYMTVIGIPVQLMFAFVCALLLNQRFRGQAIVRTIYIIPTVMPAVAVSILWLWITNPQIGLINSLLRNIGIEGPIWFRDPVWSKPTLILMLCWTVGSTIIIYLAGLQEVPRELYESAEIEGANSLQQLRHITWPLLSPVTLFNLITGLIWSFQMFTEGFLISGGAGGLGQPQGSMLFYSLYLWQNAFSYTRMGKASAMAWILFVLILVVTIITLRLSRRTTHYEVR